MVGEDVHIFWEKGVSQGWVTDKEWLNLRQAMSGAAFDAGGTGQTAQSVYGAATASESASIEASAAAAGSEGTGEIVGLAAEAGTGASVVGLGTVAAAAGTGFLGWKIGETLRDLFVGGKESNPPEAPETAQYAGIKGLQGGELAVGTEDAFGKPVQIFQPYDTVDNEWSQTGKMEANFTALKQWKNCASHPVSGWHNVGGTKTIIGSAPGQELLESPWFPDAKSEPACEAQVAVSVTSILAANFGHGFPGATTVTAVAPTAKAPEAVEKAAESAMEGTGNNTGGGKNRFPKLVAALGALAATLHALHHANPEAPSEVTIPEPGEHENYKTYDQALENLELNPENVANPESAMDPARGPDEVTDASPSPGTKVPTDTNVRVRYNPDNAPEPAAAGGCEATWGSIDFGPFSGMHLGEKFPFGLIPWVVAWIQEWEYEGVAPSFSLWTPVNPIKIDFAIMEPYIEAIRIVMVAATLLGFTWFLATAAMKFQGDAS